MPKFSLWLMPSGDAYRKLSKIILHLSKKYSTPAFDPHVTLIPDVEADENEIIDKTQRLAGAIHAPRIKLTNIDYSDNYYMSIFVNIEKTKDVVDANAKAREIFGRQSDPPYVPHLSLMYGNHNVKKEKIIEEIGRINLSFEAKSLRLVGDPADNWPKIKEFKLH